PAQPARRSQAGKDLPEMSAKGTEPALRHGGPVGRRAGALPARGTTLGVESGRLPRRRVQRDAPRHGPGELGLVVDAAQSEDFLTLSHHQRHDVARRREPFALSVALEHRPGYLGSDLLGPAPPRRASAVDRTADRPSLGRRYHWQ